MLDGLDPVQTEPLSDGILLSLARLDARSAVVFQNLAVHIQDGLRQSQSSSCLET